MRRILYIAFVLTHAVAATGCASFLVDEMYYESPHINPRYVRPPEEQIEVSGFDDIKTELLNFIMKHESSGKLYANSYSGDADEDMERACNEIITNDPIGAYAVATITGEVKRIVSMTEIEISIEYKREKEQVDSLVNVSTLRYLRTELLNAMSDYREEMIFRTSLLLTDDAIATLVKDAYYENPRRVVMLPFVAIESFPQTGEDKIFELRFGNIERSSILQQYGKNLAESHVRFNARQAVGNTDAEILLSLTNNLIASTSFDLGTAQTISIHGVQNYAATAYGALAIGNAVGEGFAMAFKALCDELRIDCRIVLGYHDGMVHAWNIVALYGHYYHIDVAMCAMNGIETAFFKSDNDFFDNYTWDTNNTVTCRGPMTYEDIVGPEDSGEDGVDGEDGEGGIDGEGGENGVDGETAGVDGNGEPAGSGAAGETTGVPDTDGTDETTGTGETAVAPGSDETGSDTGTNSQPEEAGLEAGEPEESELGEDNDG